MVCAGGVVQQSLVSVEYGDQAFRFSRTGDQGPRQAELNPGFQNFLERGAAMIRKRRKLKVRLSLSLRLPG